MRVIDLKLMLSELDGNEKIGLADGCGGYTVAAFAEFSDNTHDPECECGCVSIVLT